MKRLMVLALLAGCGETPDPPPAHVWTEVGPAPGDYAEYERARHVWLVCSFVTAGRLATASREAADIVAIAAISSCPEEEAAFAAASSQMGYAPDVAAHIRGMLREDLTGFVALKRARVSGRMP
jgi:hypothetical protein